MCGSCEMRVVQIDIDFDGQKAVVMEDYLFSVKFLNENPDSEIAKKMFDEAFKKAQALAEQEGHR